MSVATGGRHVNPCDTFRELAFSCWDLLGDGRDAKVQLGEETLTDLNVLEL